MKGQYEAACVVYTGAIDEYYNYCYGRLPYRCLRFEHEHHAEKEFYQPVAVVNYPGSEAYTRITEFKRMTGQAHRGTSIVREFAMGEGEPYYPVPRADNQALYKRYEEVARSERNVFFVGRLAQYRYYNMDQVAAASLKLASAF